MRYAMKCALTGKNIRANRPVQELTCLEGIARQRCDEIGLPQNWFVPNTIANRSLLTVPTLIRSHRSPIPERATRRVVANPVSREFRGPRLLRAAALSLVRRDLLASFLVSLPREDRLPERRRSPASFSRPSDVAPSVSRSAAHSTGAPWQLDTFGGPIPENGRAIEN
jgi:hypothetical protein